MLNGLEMQVPVKNTDSMRNMEISFMLRVSNNLDTLDSDMVTELAKIVDVREYLENSILDTNTVYHHRFFTVSKDALKCDCGKGLLCPMVVQH